MKLRLWPGSLLGQMLLSVALALLVAQSISGFLLVRAQEHRREEVLMNAAAFRLVAPPRTHRRTVRPNQRPRRARRWMTLERSANFTMAASDVRHEDRETRLHEILTTQGFPTEQLIVVTRKIADDPLALSAQRRRPRFIQDPDAAKRELLVAALQAQPDGEWVIARIPIPKPEPRLIGGVLAQTLVLYVVLVGGLALLLRRITRPLAALTKRVDHFGQTREADGQLEPHGPEDARRLIEAHNAMEARIIALLDEKDVMLGAIGHDLKTPLATLRVRIESVEDETERARMAASIEDITRTLDDILSLARVGRPSDALERTELSALIASVVEEYEDMGEPVELGEMSRVALPLRPTWLRRALRNLIGNAIRYGGVARVSLTLENGDVTIRIEDDGPGIPDDEIEAMLEPFQRGDPSRNKGTGGAGLGLTLARAIAEQHGGGLRLSNRRSTDGKVQGLVAELRLPKQV